MTEMQASEARERIGEMLARVEAGETVVVTRGGRAVARIKPEQVSAAGDVDAERAARARDAFARIDDFRKSAGPWATADEILAWREEGRKS